MPRGYWEEVHLQRATGGILGADFIYTSAFDNIFMKVDGMCTAILIDHRGLRTCEATGTLQQGHDGDLAIYVHRNMLLRPDCIGELLVDGAGMLPLHRHADSVDAGPGLQVGFGGKG